MKATGIVRRIDDLGRVVVPKEIRRTLRIREGDPLEIFTDREGEIILKKYSPIGELGEFAKQYAEALASASGYIACVTDRDQIIAAAGGNKKNVLNKSLSKELETTIQDREWVLANRGERAFIKITEEEDEEITGEIIVPILCEGDVIGSVILISKNTRGKMGEAEHKMVTVAANFLGKQMES